MIGREEIAGLIPHAQGMSLCNQGAQLVAVTGQVPPMVAGGLGFVVWHKRGLMRAHGPHKAHEVLKWIAFNVVLAIRPAFHHRGQFTHIVGADVTLIRTRMNCDSRCAGLQAKLRGTGHTGEAQIAPVAHLGHQVHIHRQ